MQECRPLQQLWLSPSTLNCTAHHSPFIPLGPIRLRVFSVSLKTPVKCKFASATCTLSDSPMEIIHRCQPFDTPKSGAHCHRGLTLLKAHAEVPVSRVPAMTCLWCPAAELDGQLSTFQASWTSPFADVAHTPRKSLEMAWSRPGNKGLRGMQGCATAHRMASPNRSCLIHMSGLGSNLRHPSAKRQSLHWGPPAASQPPSQSA